MTLKEKLDNIRRGFESKAPPEALAIMHRANDDLRASGIQSRMVKVGDRAPDFSLSGTGPSTVSLAGLLAKGPVVLSFYRGVW